MLQKGISLNDSTDLVILDRPALSAHRYIEEIFQYHVAPRAAKISKTFLLMQENARSHIAVTVSNFFNEVSVRYVK